MLIYESAGFDYFLIAVPPFENYGYLSAVSVFSDTDLELIAPQPVAYIYDDQRGQQRAYGITQPHYDRRAVNVKTERDRSRAYRYREYRDSYYACHQATVPDIIATVVNKDLIDLC